MHSVTRQFRHGEYPNRRHTGDRRVLASKDSGGKGIPTNDEVPAGFSRYRRRNETLLFGLPADCPVMSSAATFAAKNSVKNLFVELATTKRPCKIVSHVIIARTSRFEVWRRYDASKTCLIVARFCRPGCVQPAR